MKSIHLNGPKSFILLLSFIISLCQNKENYINMTVIGTGEIKLIKLMYSSEEPSKVLFNGNNYNYKYKSEYLYVNSSENKENNVIIKYNKTVKNWNFELCSSIISIDFSNFDSSYSKI